MLRHLVGIVLAAVLVVGCDDMASQSADATPNPLADLPRDQLYEALRTIEPQWDHWCHEHYTNPGEPANRANPDWCLRDMPAMLLQGLRRLGHDVTLKHVKEPWIWVFMEERMRPIWDCRQREMLKPVGQGDEAACDPWYEAHRRKAVPISPSK